MRQAFTLCAIAYAIVIIGGSHVSNARTFYGTSLQSLRPRNVIDFVHHQELDLTAAQRQRLQKYPPLRLPFCSYGTDRRTMTDLWSCRQIDPEYHCGIIGVYSEDHLSQKLADTRRHKYILVRKGWLGRVDPCRRHVEVIRRSFIYSGPLWCKREALETDLAVNRAIVEHFWVVEELGPYLVMRRLDGA